VANWNRVDTRLVGYHERPPMSAEERGLLDAVLQTPDDVGPRLIYADWLQHQRDPVHQARGELIVVQCQVETSPSPHLKEREHDLLDRFAHRWCSQLGFGGRNDWYGDSWDAEFRRGFIEHVMLWIGYLPGVVVRMFAEEPVRTLVLRGREDGVLARLPTLVALRRLAMLVLEGNRIGDAGVGNLVGSPNVSELRALRIDSNMLVDRDAAAIAESPHLGALRELSLRDNKLGAAGATALARSPRLAQLVELDLSGNAIGDVGAVALAASPHLAHLERLNVTGCGIDRPEPLIVRFGSSTVRA